MELIVVNRLKHFTMIPMGTWDTERGGRFCKEKESH